MICRAIRSREPHSWLSKGHAALTGDAAAGADRRAIADFRVEFYNRHAVERD